MIDTTNPTTITEWQAAIHQYAKGKGWWEPDRPRTFGDLLTLVNCELSEAYEEFRANRGMTEVYENEGKPGKLEGIPVELADAVIRIFDMCAYYEIDLQSVMAQKHAYNLTREYRHGNKAT